MKKNVNLSPEMERHHVRDFVEGFKCSVVLRVCSFPILSRKERFSLIMYVYRCWQIALTHSPSLPVPVMLCRFRYRLMFCFQTRAPSCCVLRL